MAVPAVLLGPWRFERRLRELEGDAAALQALAARCRKHAAAGRRWAAIWNALEQAASLLADGRNADVAGKLRAAAHHAGRRSFYAW